jgi:NitT/TauT family transport system permease protein
MKQRASQAETRLRAARWRWLVTPTALLFLLLAWKGITLYQDYPAFILPPPEMVAGRFRQAILNGVLLAHTGQTLQEILLGLMLGMAVATVLGYSLAKSRLAEQILSPYLVASQAVPIVAIAPLIFIWFGPGMLSNVLITGLIVLFPILVNTIVGVRSVPQELRDLMRAYQATRWQTFAKLELPSALPILLGGLKVGGTLAVIGATVAEFVRPTRGLGYLILTAKNRFDTDLVFVAMLTLVAIALSIYGLFSLAEAYLLAWQEPKSTA